MKRVEKKPFVNLLKDKIGAAEASFLVEMNGLTVGQANGLRASLRGVGATLQVGKARLIKVATKELSKDSNFISTIKGQVGLVFTKADSTAVAKCLLSFKKGSDGKFKLISGIYQDKFYDSVGFERLATIPSREVLLAMLAGVLNAPIAAAARALSEVANKKSIET